MCLATSAEGPAAAEAPAGDAPAPCAAAGVVSPGSSASARRSDFHTTCLGLLLVGALVLDPVAALVRAGVLAPRVGLDQALGAGDDLELAVLQDLADEHRLVGVLVGLVHLDLAARSQERLVVDGLAGRVVLERLGLLGRLLPDVDAEVGRLHRVVGHALVAAWQIALLGKGLE